VRVLIRKTIELESYFQEIDSWITQAVLAEPSKKKNTPLLITGPVGCGKSSLITKWIDFHRRSHKKDNDFLLFHYVKRSPGDRMYHFTLFRLYNKLRVRDI